MNELPADISESLTPVELVPVKRWWDALGKKEQEELLDCSQLTALDFKSLDESIGLDEIDALEDGNDLPGYFDYLVNHEFRLVGFVDETAEKSSYRVMCSYVASLGSDYRHGKPGSVW
ncbi:hypothetical protein [Bremerella sp. P1]|uniref:hypothetical protein n=1 Tax=Bremerella sp. P1 TaxID=3026424 RepID=UPI002367977E|nr:hypothetical protein [Bremerella sp. P1]WDI43143.1 hypothetical protein PSR63_04185 [Bremerella sp. P1]